MADGDALYPPYTLEFVAGDTVRLKVVVEDPDPDSPDPLNPIMIPRDLTGYTAHSQIRKSYKDSLVLASFEVSGLGVDGVINLRLPPAESQLLYLVTKAAWDLQLTDPYGDVDTILGGPVKPKGDVTRV
jgi:hypothetical protein